MIKKLIKTNTGPTATQKIFFNTADEAGAASIKPIADRACTHAAGRIMENIFLPTPSMMSFSVKRKKTVTRERDKAPVIKAAKLHFLCTATNTINRKAPAGISQNKANEKLNCGKGLPSPNFVSARLKKFPAGIS